MRLFIRKGYVLPTQNREIFHKEILPQPGAIAKAPRWEISCFRGKSNTGKVYSTDNAKKHKIVWSNFITLLIELGWELQEGKLTECNMGMIVFSRNDSKEYLDEQLSTIRQRLRASIKNKTLELIIVGLYLADS